MDKAQNLEALLDKYLQNRCSLQETDQLLQWLSSEEYGPEQKALIKKALETVHNDDSGRSVQHEAQLTKIFENISRRIGDIKHDKAKRRRRLLLGRLSAAAAAILVVIGGYLLIQNLKWHKKGNPQARLTNDLAPGGNKAVLTLNDGSQVVLGDAENGDLTTQGQAAIIKKNDQLIYNKKNGSASVFYNTITTPRGGQYQLTLEDGSKVWLNAASSIRFPTTFQGKERKIEISGEAYFEIAKDASRPFKVQFETPAGAKSEVTVLGTHFNIMSYKDEKAAKTTLLEGSVSISSNGNTAILTPAQQASQTDRDAITVASDIDMNEAIAWKNGFFEFHATGLQEVMRQIGRWYDVEISYEGKIPERKFGGKISRQNNAAEVLKILELSQVKFRIEDKKIIVTQ